MKDRAAKQAQLDQSWEHTKGLVMSAMNAGYGPDIEKRLLEMDGMGDKIDWLIAKLGSYGFALATSQTFEALRDEMDQKGGE